MAAISGVVKGGPNPIVGAHVTLWQTQSGATYNATATTKSNYGSAAKVLATATTGTLGGFNFTGQTYTCAPDEYVYITATGGDAGSGANPQSVQMAALGSCSNFQTSAQDAAVNIYMGEVSTVAAAYALGHFMNVIDPLNGQQLVYVGAPLANDTASPACTGSGATMSCTANGLGEAFATAANLVDAVGFNGAGAYGYAYATSPSNSSASVPQAEINLIANIQQACTNSTGGAAGDGSVCGSLFTLATPPAGSPPTNILQTVINIARYPEHNAFALASLATAPAVFTPSLAVSGGAPADLSIGITYPTTTFGTTSATFSTPISTTLDAAGNVYMDDSVNGTTTDLYSFSNNGAGRWASTGGAQTGPEETATDTLGQVWIANTGKSNAARIVECYLQTTGTACTTPSYNAGVASGLEGLAVDRSNNLWATTLSQSGSSAAVVEFTAPTYAAVGYGSLKGVTTSVALDSGQNVWAVQTSAAGTAGTYLYIPAGSAAGTAITGTLPTNTGSASYGTQSVEVAAKTINNSTGAISQGIYMDESGSYSYIQPTYNSSDVVTGITSAVGVTVAAATNPGWGEVDGDGTHWYPGSIQTVYGTTNASQFSAVTPCYAPNGATTCATTSATTNPAPQYPKQVVVDAAGSMWIAFGSSTVGGATTPAGGALVQVVGTASPTWPQLSYGVPGSRPQ